MDKQALFDALVDMIMDTDVDFVEVYVGDEQDGQVYVRFENVGVENERITF